MAGVTIFNDEPDWKLVVEAWLDFHMTHDATSTKPASKEFLKKLNVEAIEYDLRMGWKGITFPNEEAYLLFKLEWS